MERWTEYRTPNPRTMSERDAVELSEVAGIPPNPRFNYRHQYDDTRDDIERVKSDIHITEPSLTIQSYTEEVDLNVMVARMGIKDGSIPAQAMDPRHFGDFLNVADLREIFDRVREATNRFNELPADLRRRFRNSPAELLDFVSDPANDEESVRLGLLESKDKKTQAAPTPSVPQSNPPASAPA